MDIGAKSRRPSSRTGRGREVIRVEASNVPGDVPRLRERLERAVCPPRGGHSISLPLPHRSRHPRRCLDRGRGRGPVRAGLAALPQPFELAARRSCRPRCARSRIDLETTPTRARSTRRRWWATASKRCTWSRSQRLTGAECHPTSAADGRRGRPDSRIGPRHHHGLERGRLRSAHLVARVRKHWAWPPTWGASRGSHPLPAGPGLHAPVPGGPFPAAWSSTGSRWCATPCASRTTGSRPSAARCSAAAS